MTIIEPNSAMQRASRFFGLATVGQLDRDLLIALVTRQIGAVHVRGLVSPEDCAAVLRGLGSSRFNAFDVARYQVPTFNLGPILNHYLPNRRITDGYWEEASRAEEFWRTCPADVRAFCLEHVGAVWGSSVGYLTHDGQPLFRGILRDNSRGAPPHWDDLSIEFPAGFVTPTPLAQLSFVLYLQIPDAGGETDVWPRRWVPSDDRYRVGSCWPAIPLEDTPVTVRPAVGDAMIFDPRNYHRVRPGLGGRRMTMASYLGITAEGSLVGWS